MKAKFLEVMPGIPVEQVDNLVQEINQKFGVYSLEDLKDLDDGDLAAIESIKKVPKKKFDKYVKECRSSERMEE